MREILDREENSRTTEDEWLNIQLEEPEHEGEETHENRGNHPGRGPQHLPTAPTFEQQLRDLEERNRQLIEERDRERNRKLTEALNRESNNNDDRGQDSGQSAPPSPAVFHSIPTSPVDMMTAGLDIRTTNLENTVPRGQMSANGPPEVFANLTDNLYLGNPNLRNARTRRTEADGAQEINSPHPATQATSIPEPNGGQMDDDETMYA